MGFIIGNKNNRKPEMVSIVDMFGMSKQHSDEYIGAPDERGY